MPYTMINFTAVGFDIVRLPHGDRVSEVLSIALALGADDLATMASCHPGDEREQRFAVLKDTHRDSAADLRQNIAALVSDQDADTSTEAALTVLKTLQTSPVGSLEALERLIRHHILDWTWDSVASAGDIATQSETARMAADVLVDAAAAAYAAGQLSAHDRREMTAPFAAVCRKWKNDGRDLPTLAVSPDVTDALQQLSGLSPDQLLAWNTLTSETLKEVGVWAGAMNQACWAVHVSGRERTAAAAQLGAVMAMREAGISTEIAAKGVWNLISGAIQANATKDILDATHYNLLTEEWRRIMK